MDWDTIKLFDHIETLKGFAFKSAWYQDAGIPIVRVSDFTVDSVSLEAIQFIDSKLASQYVKYELKENDVVIQTVGSWQNNPASVVGKVVSIPQELNKALLNQNAVKIIPKDTINNIFLFYFLKNESFKNYILGCAQGAANQASITLNSIGNFSFILPPLKTQQKIASILSNYDKLIENNTQRIKLLESMAEELYKEWFVRLRFPGYEDVEVVDGLPVEWEKKPINKYLKYHRGKSYSSEDIAGDTGLPFINLKCINRNGGFRRDGIKIFNGKYKDSNVAYEGDIVMSVTDMTQDRAIVGRVAKVPTMYQDKYIVSMDLVKIEPLNIEKDFLYALLRFSSIGLSLKEFANGVNVLHLTPDMIYLQKVTIPPKKLQIEFEKIFVPILKEIDILNLKNDELKQTRDLLLPRLMSGKLNVEDLDII